MGCGPGPPFETAAARPPHGWSVRPSANLRPSPQPQPGLNPPTTA